MKKKRCDWKVFEADKSGNEKEMATAIEERSEEDWEEKERYMSRSTRQERRSTNRIQEVEEIQEGRNNR